MLKVIFAPVRFTVFVLIGALVLCCVPESDYKEGSPERSENPPQKMGRTY